MKDVIILGVLKPRADENNQAKYLHTIAQEIKGILATPPKLPPPQE